MDSPDGHEAMVVTPVTPHTVHKFPLPTTLYYLSTLSNSLYLQ